MPELRGEHITVTVAALDPLSISSACTACGGCLRTCPEHALRPAPTRQLVVATRCTSCRECVEICPTDSITLPGGDPTVMICNQAGFSGVQPGTTL